MLKKIAKYIMFFSFALVLANETWGNLSFLYRTPTIITVALILTIFELFLKPILKILLLPINLITLGSLRLIINTLGIYLAVFLLADFKVRNILVTSFNWQGFVVPDLRFLGFWAYLITSMTLGIYFYIFNFIIKKKT